MGSLRRVVAFSITSIALAMIVLASLLAPTASTEARRPPLPTKAGPLLAHHHLMKGSATLPTSKSRPLHAPGNPPPPVTVTKGVKKLTTQRAAATKNSANLNLCLAQRIDLKVLVIATDGNEADLPAIQQTLDYLGTPYSVYRAASTPNGLTPDKLSNGCHGYYQGIILTNGALVYYNGSAWVSALSQQEWTTLWSYEVAMGVRELSWYTFPTVDFGYQPLRGAVDTSLNPLPTTLTSQGQATFLYLNSHATIPIQYAYTYLAQPLTDGSTTPLLSDANGNALMAIHQYPDGRQVLSLTFDSNPYLMHTIVLSYGLVNWLTQGLFLGERHIRMSPQIDDVFIDDSDWLTTTPCGTPVDNTGATYRITSSDLQALLNWQTSKRSVPVSASLTLTMAFNGYGTSAGAYTPDTLTPAAQANQGQFYWLSHTYNHANLDSVTYATAASEITQNQQVATAMGLTHFSSASMVTPDVSGLTNPNFLQAAHDNGLRYLVTDTSKPGYNNPSPNVGIYNPYQPQILMLPRHPNNLFYNVSTPAGWVAEYNCIYHSFWGRDLSYQEILNVESQTLATYMLKGDLDPWMFHQPNLRAYDGTHSLFSDLLDLTLQKYTQFFNLAIIHPAMDSLGQTVAQRMQYNAAAVTASVVPGVSITITAQKEATVPVTGLYKLGAETYGGQHISYVHLFAGQSILLPLL